MARARENEGLVFRETERPLRVLVIDEEKAVRALLETVLRAEGMEVDTTGSREEARAFLSKQTYDLLMIEEGVPSRHGVELLGSLRGAGLGTPALVMTAYPTAEMLDAAFEAGASDFIKKPFAGIAHLVSRACLVAEQGTADRFYDRLVGELSASARAEGSVGAVYRRALRSCKETRALLERRPEAVIVDRDPSSAEGVASVLRDGGHQIETIDDPAKALARVTDPRGPLVLIVDLGVAGALTTVARARATSAPPEIVVLGGQEHLFDALQGVDLGASDYCLRDEKRDALARRVTRAVERARRRFLKREVLELVRKVSLELEKLDCGGDDEGAAGPPKAARPAPSDKRLSSSRRFEVDLPAIVTPEGGSAIHAGVRDVSANGMFVATPEPLARDSRLRVYLDTSSLGLSGSLEAPCVVRWSVRYDPDPAGSSGMGVCLVEEASGALAPLLEKVRRL